MTTVADLKGVVEKVSFYCNVNKPLTSEQPHWSHHCGVITERNIHGIFMYEQRELDVKTGHIVYCRLEIKRVTGEEYFMYRRFGVIRYVTSTDPDYVGGLIG